MHNHSQSGLTLIELLVTMLVSGILISAVYSVFSTHHKMAIKQEESTLMQQELLNAMIRITEELRMCGFSITGSQDFGFSHQSAIGAPRLRARHQRHGHILHSGLERRRDNQRKRSRQRP